MTTFAGVDGCRAGWVVAVLDPGGFAPPTVCSHLAEVVQATAPAALTLVDIPMGLTDQDHPRERACEREARRLLGRQRSSIFPVPVRAAVHAGTYAEACMRNCEATGRKLSRQTWGITPKIAEADWLLRGEPSLQHRLRESHPELCFLALNGWTPLAATGKKTREGQAERLALLARYVAGAEGAFTEALARYPRKAAAPDDLLDAMVLAVAARQAFAAGIPTIPAEPETDALGLKMEIVCPAILPQGS